MPKKGWVYIVTNRKDGTLYIGVTSELRARIAKHKNRAHPGSFTARYNLDKLVYHEEHESMWEAIEREKQLKAGPRKKKVALIEAMNPEWADLFESLA